MHFCPRARVFLGLTLALLAAPPTFAREKTDIVTLRNGDQITCEIKKLARGKLTVSTTYMGTLEIEWRGVESIESHFAFEVGTQTGARYRGTVAGSEEGRLVRVGSDGALASLPVSSVVEMAPIEDRFWDRIDFALNLGYNFTSSNNTTQWNFGTNGKYQQGSYEVAADLSSFINAQEETDATKRNELAASVSRSLDDGWVVKYIGQANQDSKLSLELRSLLGAGIGRSVVRNNYVELTVSGGGAYTREWYTGEEPVNGAEALGGTQLDVFVFGGRETDIATTFYVLPSLTQWGRVRAELRTNLRIELLNDLFWGFELFNSYDSNPPRANIQGNSFGVGTSIGWKF